jgi:hypothetical protein
MFRAKCTAFVVITCGLLVARFAMADEMICHGAIIKVEGENVTVKDMDSTKELEMKVEPGTKITSAGKPVSPMDLKIGQKVKCVCDKRNESLVCTTMEIMRDTP